MPKESILWPKYFTRFEVNKDGKSLKQATCNYCPEKDGKKKIYETNKGTGNLWRHLQISHPTEAAAAAAEKEGAAEQPCPPSGSSIASGHREARMEQDEAMQDMEEAPNAEGCGRQEYYAGAGTSEQPPQPQPSLLAQDDEPMQQIPSSGLQEEACKDLARMIALDGYDASVLQSDYFRSFVRRLNPEFEVPSRVAIENMCDGIFDEERRDLLDRLRRAHGKVSVAVGRAKTMEEQVFYVACHFIDDGWSLHKPVLHAFVTTDHHDDSDGPILGLDVSTCAIHESVPDVIPQYLYNRLFMVAYETTHKNICDSLKGCGYFWQCGPNRNGILFTTYMDNVLHSIARCLLPDEYFTQNVYNEIRRLKLTRQGRLDLLAELDLHYGWAYEEHWYACYCSLQVLSKKGFPVQLTDQELVIAKLLCNLWEKIYRAIQKISSSTGPTANLCLAELFKLRGVLHPELTRFSSEDHGYDYCVFDDDDKDVKCVLIEACDTLDNAIKDSFLVWSLPLALDPRYKLDYLAFNFQRAYDLEAAEEYISEVTTMVTELYADYVKEYGTSTAGGAHHYSDGASAMDTTTSADYQLEQAWNEHCPPQQGMATHQVSSFYHLQAETELDRYLKDPPHDPQAEGFDILNWWKAHSWEYPMVARMARDALAMPTCRKLSSDQMAQLRSILRGYSKKPYEC